MKSRYKLGAVGIILSSIWIYFQVTKKDPAILPLPNKAVERIVIDPTNHHLTIIKPGSSEDIFLPSGPSTIDLGKDGKLTVTAPQFGFEENVFAGYGYSRGQAVIVGVDLLYYKRFDLGAGVIIPTTQSIGSKVDMGVVGSYTVYHNIRVSCSVNQSKGLGVFATVRF